MKTKSFASRRIGALVAILVAGAAANASAVIRSPFPSRPTPPDHGRYVMINSESLTAWPTPATPAPTR